MAHLFINHHFFYGDDGFGKVLKGPSAQRLRQQLAALTAVMRPAASVFEHLDSDQLVFSITVDDGSRSILDMLPLFREFGVTLSLCICSHSTLHQGVLLIHKINFLRAHYTDSQLWHMLLQQHPAVETYPLRCPVQPEHLYRYDQEATRQLKIALNYRLSHPQANAFVSPLFEQAYGSEAEMSRQLYLSPDDLKALRGAVNIFFHGNEHRLWSTLSLDELKAELTPAPAIRELLSDNYVLSIPFGMAGAWDEPSLLAARGKASGAFTMGRHLGHTHSGDFYWLHRFDQADLFAPDGTFQHHVTDLKAYLHR